MHCDTGDLYKKVVGESWEDLARRQGIDKQAELDEFTRQLAPITEEQAEELKPMPRKMRKNTMRNKPCVCGSGVKFKRCCWDKFA